MTNGSKGMPGNGEKSRDDSINIKWATKTVEFDRAKMNRLAQARNTALGAGFKEFMFEHDDYDINYAKYLLEYLQTRLT